jgi:uncharacterized protein (TIGR00730 family)
VHDIDDLSRRSQLIVPSQLKSVCVYCGSNVGSSPVFAEIAASIGAALAEAGIRVVYGGGRVGLMGIVADAARAAGGDVVGIIPAALDRREVAHTGLTELHIVQTMHERKAMMAELSDAFLTLPGGLGTLEELFETLTWSQLGIHRKPVGLINIDGYFDPLLTMLDHFVARGFLRQEHRDLLLEADTLPELLRTMEGWTPPTVEKWF